MPITVKHTKVSAIPDAGDANLVQPSDWNADHALTGLGTMAEQDANAVAITGGTMSGVAITGYIPSTEKGTANGVATLDAGGKVPVSELPAAVLGALNYQGTWDASTNTPTLTSSVGSKGYYYVVSVAGNTNLNGITDWLVGDWAVYNGTVWQKVDNTDAGGDVVGPASATDNAITRFDQTTGKLIQNSTVTLDDNGNIINTNSLGLDTTPATVPTTVGTMYWDTGNKAPSITLENGVELQLGQENVVLVYNNTASTITNGSVVAVNGAQGQRPAVVLADADSEPLSAGTLGIATENIASGAEGFVTTFGLIRGIDTSAFTAGNPVYLSTTAGQFTATRPSAPAHTVFLGWIIKVNASSGELFVNISNGWELDELHNVFISSPTGGNLLAYDQTNAYWKNINLTDGTAISITETTGGSITIANTGVTQATAGTGISVSAGTGNVTITNTAPDQTVSLSAGTGISTSGTYPNFTITNTAPDQTVSLTGAGTTTISGTYPNFTITSDDQFDGTVTSVDLTAGTGISVSGGPITSSGSITVTNTAPDQVVAISAGTGISVSGTYPNFTVTNTSPSSGGTVTSVAALTLGTTGTDLSSTVANSTTTPVITLNVPTASATNRGALSAADWTTFNGKANAFTYTTNYIPYGQGTTTPTQSANLTFDGTTQTAPIQRASNGIVTNNKTIGTSFTIPSTDNAMSAGPVTLSSGVTVTVSSGSRWVVL